MGQAHHAHDVPRGGNCAYIACEYTVRIFIPVSCFRPISDRLDFRPPTLSYTKTLETKVAELEATIAQLRNPQSRQAGSVNEEPEQNFAEAPEPSPGTDKSGEQTEEDLSQDFEGLKVEDDGRVSYHGQTSLFHLPSGAVSESLAPTHLGLGLDARKERLINNAWRERAFEQLACIPV